MHQMLIKYYIWLQNLGYQITRILTFSQITLWTHPPPLEVKKWNWSKTLHCYSKQVLLQQSASAYRLELNRSQQKLLWLHHYKTWRDEFPYMYWYLIYHQNKLQNYYNTKLRATNLDLFLVSLCITKIK